MEYKNDRLGVSFTLPDRPTVREQMRYFSTVRFTANPDRLECQWAAATALIREWKCARLPVLEAIDLDALTDPTDLNILVWASTQTVILMNDLEDVPKN